MKGEIQAFAPAVLALFWGILNLSHFIEYQRTASPYNPQGVGHNSSRALPETRETDGGAALRSAWQADSSPPPSPFRSSIAAQAANGAQGQVRRAMVQRPGLILKGTVGNQAATLSDASGRKIIVRVGDYWDSIQVMRIGPGKVTLRDRHGSFDILSKE